MEYKVRYKNELYHHGILGQKWGQKNGPPYPLDAEDHSAKEKKAGWRKSLSADNKLKTIQKFEKKEFDMKKALSDFVQSDTFKTAMKVAITAGVVYGAAQLGRKFIEDRADFDIFEYARIMASNPQYDPQEVITVLQQTHIRDRFEQLPTDYDSFDEIPRTKSDFAEELFSSDYDNEEIERQLLDGINPGWPREKGHTNNCMLCTSSIIMKMKGYDVSANGTKDGFLTEQAQEWFDNSHYHRLDLSDFDETATYQNVMDRIADTSGNNTYGNIVVNWKTGGGHSMFYYVREGELNIIDGQSQESYDVPSLLSEVDLGSIEFIDMTNATPTELALHCVSKPRHK